MKTTYRLGRKETGRNQVWTTLASDTSIERLQAQAAVDNDTHPGMYEYTIVAKGLPW